MKARGWVVGGFVLLTAGLSIAQAQSYDRAGWEAQLGALTHGVSGTIRMVDADTLAVENFSYDGGGPLVYFYLGADNTDASFTQGLPVGPLLSGTRFSNESLVIDLPAGLTLDGYNAISVWCVDRRVGFGSGTFGSVVQYVATFDATWSGATHEPFPPNPHFSGLIGATHNADAVFWAPETLASPGIENMAELGSKSPLTDEINAQITAGAAYNVISGGGISPSPGQVSVTFRMNASHPRVSLVSMIAPSPDWFVGVADLELFADGVWRDEVVVDLVPWDAGTDGGPNFTSPDADTNPAEPIGLIAGFPFEGAPPLGTFTFRLVCPEPPAGDLNGDCRVDFQDLAILMSNWLLDCNAHPGDPRCPPVDIDRGRVRMLQ